MTCRIKNLPPATCSSGNSTCLNALRASLVPGGMLANTIPSLAQADTVLVGAPICSIVASARASLPCVSANFKLLSLRDECSIWVYAGCNDGTTEPEYDGVACETRPGSRIALDARTTLAPSDPRSPSHPNLAGEWIVGPDPTSRGASHFWVFRADGNPHGFTDVSNPLLSPGAAAIVGRFNCLLEPHGSATGFGYPTACPSGTAAVAAGAAAGAVAVLLSTAIALVCVRRRRRRASRGAAPPLSGGIPFAPPMSRPAPAASAAPSTSAAASAAAASSSAATSAASPAEAPPPVAEANPPALSSGGSWFGRLLPRTEPPRKESGEPADAKVALPAQAQGQVRAQGQAQGLAPARLYPSPGVGGGGGGGGAAVAATAGPSVPMVHMPMAHAQPVGAYDVQPVMATVVDAVIVPNVPQRSVADELSRLAELHRTGALTDAEYTDAKARVLQTF